MLTETFVAIFLLVCLGCFFSVNLHNILKGQKLRRSEKVHAEVERPLGSIVGLAAVGTIVYFLEVLSYLFLAFTGLIFMLCDFPFLFQLPFMFYMQILGLSLTSAGYFLFIWSVVVRGRYAVSWEMPENQKLVTSGPYRYVRHPSYLGYFLMFSGFFFLWSNLFTLFPLVAIPGYFRVTFEEERLLVRRFGDEYLEYQKKTGRFIPRFR
jgi:protein-S-isoprenylcysteine O-methyltransferase Ste14